jgi:uracil phosphoribosyltransferase
MSNLHIIDHPLIQHKLTYLRSVDTKKSEFRLLLNEISCLMAYEVTRHLSLKPLSIMTPLEPMVGQVLAQPISVIAVLRAGLGMTGGILSLLPEASEGHIGLVRDPLTKQPLEYMVKLPPVAGRLVMLVDPMLATGNSAIAAAHILLKKGALPADILFINLIAAPEGIQAFQKEHPGVAIYTACVDERLDEHAYIRPGLGDAGDRMFGT